jgi:hypothetical protein
MRPNVARARSSAFAACSWVSPACKRSATNRRPMCRRISAVARPAPARWGAPVTARIEDPGARGGGHPHRVGPMPAARTEHDLITTDPHELIEHPDRDVDSAQIVLLNNRQPQGGES